MWINSNGLITPITQFKRFDCAICDVDGTIADIEHRRPYISKNTPKKERSWYKFRDLSYKDTPIKPVIKIVNSLALSGLTVIHCTGRMYSECFATLSWFKNNHVLSDYIRFRPDGDYRADYIVKQEMLDDLRSMGFNVIMTFDDRQQVVDMWRGNGIVCAQVAKGDF